MCNFKCCYCVQEVLKIADWGVSNTYVHSYLNELSRKLETPLVQHCLICINVFSVTIEIPFSGSTSLVSRVCWGCESSATPVSITVHNSSVTECGKTGSKLHLCFFRRLQLFSPFVDEWFINCDLFQNVLLYTKKVNKWRSCYLQVIMQWFYWSVLLEIELGCVWPMD